jgi:hypothetical protein
VARREGHVGAAFESERHRPGDNRINRLKMLVMGFQVAWGTDTEIEIKKAAN